MKDMLLPVDCTYSNLQLPMLAGVADALLTPYSACTLQALQAFGIKPTTFQLVFSCHGITFLTGFGIILMLLVAGTLQDIAEFIKTPTAFTGNITENLYKNRVGLQQIRLEELLP